MNMSSFHSTSPTALDVCFLNFDHSNTCVIVYLYLNLYFPGTVWYGASSHMLIATCFYSFGEVSVQIVFQLFNHLFIFLYLILRVLCMFMTTDLYLMFLFFPVCNLSSHSLDIVFCSRIFQFVNYILHASCFWSISFFFLIPRFILLKVKNTVSGIRKERESPYLFWLNHLCVTELSSFIFINLFILIGS